MTITENIAVIKQAAEAYNSSGVEGFAEFMDEYVIDYLANGRLIKGRDAFVKDNIAFADIFSDLRVEITNIFGQGDWVCLQGVMTGTHQGQFKLHDGTTIPPTGKSIRIPICNLAKLKDGKIVEIHEYFDQMTFFVQLQE